MVGRFVFALGIVGMTDASIHEDLLFDEPDTCHQQLLRDHLYDQFYTYHRHAILATPKIAPIERYNLNHCPCDRDLNRG